MCSSPSFSHFPYKDFSFVFSHRDGNNYNLSLAACNSLRRLRKSRRAHTQTPLISLCQQRGAQNLNSFEEHASWSLPPVNARTHTHTHTRTQGHGLEGTNPVAGSQQ